MSKLNTNEVCNESIQFTRLELDALHKMLFDSWLPARESCEASTAIKKIEKARNAYANQIGITD